MNISGKKAMVVGGASGMARATAEDAGRAGCVGRHPRPADLGRRRSRPELGGTFHPCDVTDHEGTEIALSEAVDALGGLHIAVNTAGGGIAKRTLGKRRSAPARRVPRRHRAEPDRDVQPEPAAGVAHEHERARGRRARRHHQHRVDRGVRGPDRPGRVHRGQGRASRGWRSRWRATSAPSGSGSWRSRRACSAPASSKGITDEMAAGLTKDSSFPKRMGRPEEYARLAIAIVETPMLNGSTIRLDAGTRFAPK